MSNLYSNKLNSTDHSYSDSKGPSDSEIDKMVLLKESLIPQGLGEGRDGTVSPPGMDEDDNLLPKESSGRKYTANFKDSDRPYNGPN